MEVNMIVVFLFLPRNMQCFINFALLQKLFKMLISEIIPSLQEMLYIFLIIKELSNQFLKEKEFENGLL